MRKILIVAAIMVSGLAQAQQYEPITIDAPTFALIKNYLGEQPNKFAGPLANYFDRLAADALKAAQDAKAKAEADNATEPQPKE